MKSTFKKFVDWLQLMYTIVMLCLGAAQITDFLLIEMAKITQSDSGSESLVIFVWAIILLPASGWVTRQEGLAKKAAGREDSGE